MLTDVLIEALPVPEKRREIADSEVGGFYLIVQPSGAKSWAVRYRFNGAPRKFALGRYPALDLAAARERAREVLKGVAAGKDPAADKQAAGVERKAQFDGVDRAAKPRAGETRKTEQALVREVAAPWEGRPLSQITRVEVHELLDKILDHGAPMRANRLFADLLSNWAAAHGWADQGATAPSPGGGRDRVLTDEEIRLAWSAFDRMGWPFGPIGKLLLLTGARREEIGSARWSEVDFVSKTWTVAKDGVKREIPLSEPAVRILEGLPRADGGDGFIFSTAGRIDDSEFSRAKAAVDKRMVEILREQARERGEDLALVKRPARWRLNDLRLTVATYLQRLNVKLEVAEAMLDRNPSSRTGIAVPYHTHEYAHEKRTALAVWANRLDALVAGSAAQESLEGEQRRLGGDAAGWRNLVN
jgi:integrase